MIAKKKKEKQEGRGQREKPGLSHTVHCAKQNLEKHTES